MKAKHPAFLLIPALSLLLGVTMYGNLRREYRAGDYVESKDAYFAAKLKDPTGLTKADKTLRPSDPKYSSQLLRSHSPDMIGDIESVWSSYTGQGTTIAIIDDGFDYNHPEFIRSDGTSAILPESRSYWLDQDENGDYYVYYDDYATNPSCIAEDWGSDGYGGYEWATHGTNTSSTAAAPINGVGGVGIAPDANILALKIDFTFAALEEAINYAVSQGVDVINMSLGAYEDSFTDGWGDKHTANSGLSSYLEDACLAAYNAGVIVVASAGNESTWHKSYPACNSHVVGVGALEFGDPDTLAAFTNYVKTGQTGEINVDILAPGYVYTAHQLGTQDNIQHGYDDTQGTSFSSPIVAGAAALWKEKYPNGTPDQFLTQLQATASDIGSYANKMIPVSDWDSDLADVGPSNIEAGRLNVGALLDINNPYVTLQQSGINIAVGESQSIRLGAHSGTITYSSADSAIATVSDQGVVQGVSAGSTSITVTATKNAQTATAELPVTVNPIVAATSIQFNPSSITLNVGGTYDAEAILSVEPENASRVFLFESVDESVATVDEDTGLITAVAAGSTTINAIAGYGEGFDSLAVTVQASAQTPVLGSIYFGDGDDRVSIDSASVSATDSLGNSWNISSLGNPYFGSGGAYSQIGSSNNPASSITFTLTMASAVEFTGATASLGGFSGTAGNVSIKVGSTTIGTGTLSGTNDVNIMNTSIATGTTLTISITSISKGVKAYSITYVYLSDAAPTPTVSNVTVSPSSLSLDLYNNATGSLSATVNGTNSPAQTVTWTSSNTNIATVASDGTVTAVAVGSATIRATSTVDNTKYGTCIVSVSDSTPVVITLTSITISNYKTSFTVGDSFSFNGTVTAHFSDDSSSNVTASATFSGYNMAVAGIYTVTVSYTYQGVTRTATYSITVTASAAVTTTVVYSVASKTSATVSSGTAPTGSSVSFSNNDSNAVDQMTNGKRELWTFKNYSGYEITKIRADLRRNSSKGSGTVSLINNGQTVDLAKNVYAVSDLTSSYQFYDIVGQGSGFEVEGDVVLTLTSTENSFWCDKVEISYRLVDNSDKIINSLSAVYNGPSLFVGDDLNESNIVVTAHYTNSEKYPNVVLPSSDYTIVGFSGSTAGTKTLTITYIGALSTSVSPLTTTLQIEVSNDSVTTVNVSCSTVFHPGDVIDKSAISVSLDFASGAHFATDDFEFIEDGYRFTYEDAPSGGTSGAKQFSIRYDEEIYHFTVSVSRVAYVAPTPSTTTLTGTQARSAGITGTTTDGAADYASITINGVVCEVENAYVFTTGGKDYLSFGKAKGHIRNIQPLSKPLSSLDIHISTASSTRNDGKLYVSTNGSDWVLKVNADFDNNDYRYFKIAYESSSSNYSNIEYITLGFYGADTASNVANYIMIADTENQCLSKLDLAIAKLNTMSSAEKNTFWTSSEYRIESARTRLIAWATSQGRTLSYLDGSFVANSQGLAISFDMSNDGRNDLAAVLLIVIAVSCAGACLIALRAKTRRRELN